MNQRLLATMMLLCISVSLAGQDQKHTFWEGEPPELLPETVFTKNIQNAIEKLQPNMGVEVLFRYTREGFDFGTPEAHRVIYNTLRSVSRMEGLHYYSSSRKKMRLLFKSSYVIDDPQTRTLLPDPVVDQVPEHNMIYIFQKDLTTGGNLYQSDYYSSGSTILLQNINLNTLFYYFLPMVRPGNSLSVLLVSASGKQLLFYSLTAYRMAGFSALARRREDSLYNRMKALYGWFVQELELKLSL